MASPHSTQPNLPAVVTRALTEARERRERRQAETSLEEQRLLENSLTELRFRFIQALEESKKG